jgi:hypothetical protein
MTRKSRYEGLGWLLGLCLVVILLFGCESKDKYVGVYKAQASDSSKQAEVVLELKANGDGLWRVGSEEVNFAWDIKGGELRVNTKRGGVIVGKMDKDTIQITLPSSKTMSFKKVQ